MRIKSENGVMLLGAGAILVAILILSMGIYTYNSANATIRSTSRQMMEQEKYMYDMDDE